MMLKVHDLDDNSDHLSTSAPQERGPVAESKYSTYVLTRNEDAPPRVSSSSSPGPGYSAGGGGGGVGRLKP